MGRPPIGARAMTNLERQQRFRERHAPVMTPDQTVAGVASWLDCISRLPVDEVPAALDRLTAVIKQAGIGREGNRRAARRSSTTKRRDQTE